MVGQLMTTQGERLPMMCRRVEVFVELEETSVLIVVLNAVNVVLGQQDR